MKSIDFTKPGGFPLTQDQLNYLQKAYVESTNALAMMGGSGPAAFIISGMEITSPSAGSYDISDGWFFYNGEMVRFTASSVSGIGGGTDAYVVISPSVNSLVFYDGSTPNVIFDSTADLQALPAITATDTTHFPLSALQPFGVKFGQANREANWNSLVVSTGAAVGGVTGTVYYKKDFTANTLHIRGALSANDAQNFAASPLAVYSVMGVLPSEYTPVNTAYFTAYYFTSSQIKDDLGIAWLKQINCALNTSGQLYVNWIRPDIAIVGYGINFNTIIPLD
jgi:hypothetical protein